MEELGINKGGGSVCFGQLLGMCDHVSLTLGESQDFCTVTDSRVSGDTCSCNNVFLLTPLAKEGFAVYKSVPYGSIDDTLPYLLRRAQENRTVLQGIRKERDLLRKELYRRLRLRRDG